MRQPTFARPLEQNFDNGLLLFLRELETKNRSPETVRAYRSDITQLTDWLKACAYQTPREVGRDDLQDYLSTFVERNLSTAARRRKIVAIREYFRCLLAAGWIRTSPAADLEKPKEERKTRTHLTAGEYNRMLVEAAGNRRDYALLTVFLRTGVRVSELCALTLADIDFKRKQLHVAAGKGGDARDLPLTAKAIKALKTYIEERPAVPYPQLFLNQDEGPLGQRGARKIVDKYRVAAGIERRASCHALRHTFASHKAPRVSPFQLRDWLGHRDLKTTMIYVHLNEEEARRVMEASDL